MTFAPNLGGGGQHQKRQAERTQAVASFPFEKSSVPIAGVLLKWSMPLSPLRVPEPWLEHFALEKEAVKQVDPQLFTKELTLFITREQEVQA